MPELPEVETIARQLRGMVVGRTVTDFRSDWVRLTEPEPVRLFTQRLRDRRVLGVRRRGKFVVFELTDEMALVVSLRMTGRFTFHEAEAPNGNPHVRGTLVFDDGSNLVFADARKFGRMALVPLAEIAADRGAAPGGQKRALYASLGIEPLSRGFTVGLFAALLRRRALAAIKPLLLDQRVIAGVGNIYAIEALWRARIHPLRTAGSLKTDEIACLHEAVRWVLRKGIRFGGASRRDYYDARGEKGRMQQEFQVYARAGEPCARCGAVIRRTVVAARGTFHCPRCQRAPRALS